MGIFSRRPKEIEQPVFTPGQAGYGVPFHLAFEKRPLPSAGANSYAFESLQLPMYSPIGWGVANQRAMKTSPSSPIQYSRQGVVLQSIAYNGNNTGFFVSQPLLDPSQNNNPFGPEAGGFPGAHSPVTG